MGSCVNISEIKNMLADIVVSTAVGVKTSRILTLKTKSGTKTTNSSGKTVAEGVGEEYLLDVEVVLITVIC